ncbi:MAG: hypothetical protein ACI9QA_000622 [Methanobacteriota archaeon]|jgi:hypothetical protein
MQETVGELLRRTPGDGVALVADGKEYSEEVFYTTCHKTANLLNHLGAHPDGVVGVSPKPVAENVFGFLGACLVGAETRFVGSGGLNADVLVCDTASLDGYDVPASCRTLAHGDGVPADATGFDREIWGENPVFPRDLGGDDPVVLDGKRSSEAVDEAREVVEERNLWNGDEVRVSSLEDDGVEIITALVARATVVFGAPAVSD